MYIHIYTYTYVYVYIYICIYTHTIYIYLHTHTLTHTHTHKHVCVCVCVCVYGEQSMKTISGFFLTEGVRKFEQELYNLFTKKKGPEYEEEIRAGAS